MPRIAPDALHGFVTDLLIEIGTPGGHAGAVAASLVAADLRGHNSHGSMRVPRYGRMIDDGAIVPDAVPTVETSGPAARIDGGDAYGQLVGREGVDVAVEAADENGLAAVGVRNASHLGRVGEWAERAADRGYLFLAFVNTQGGSATVAAPGTVDRRLSTNPIAVGIPTFDRLPFPIVLDAATSQVANGKVRDRVAKGDPVPEGWLIGPDGEPMTDGARFMAGEGAALPLGGLLSGYKGFGFGLIAELLAGIVSDGQVMGQRSAEWASNAAAFVAIDPLRFTSRSAVGDRVTALAAHLRSADPSPAVPLAGGARPEPAALPGEPEYRVAMDRLDAGIPLPDRVVEELVELADGADRAIDIPDAFVADDGPRADSAE